MHTLGEVRKAIGAGVGGAVAATGVVPFMPEETPWYGYLILYGITIVLPALLAYLPRNDPPS